jgi:hypothetical protein
MIAESSLLRHAKRCTLEPTPSVRQKACRSCIFAKARCDLQRPACSRCDTRDIPCVYARPVRTVGRQEPAPTTTSNSGSAPDANSGLGPGYGPAAPPQPNLDTGRVNIADADRDVTSYLGCGAGFVDLPTPESAIHSCLLPELFPSASADPADATPNSGQGFDPVYATSCSTPSTHAAPNTHSHHSASPYAGSLEAPIDLDGSSPAVDVDLCVIPQGNLGGMRSGGDSWPAITPEVGEIEPWMLALAAKPITPDPPCLVEHSGMQPSQALFLFFPSVQLPDPSLLRGER